MVIMTGNLLSSITSKKPSESAGADTASRFDYQKRWAFCEMINRHLAGEDYLVVFEFHEDVLFLSPEVEPDSIDFVQVKTSKSTNPRKLVDITRNGSAGSILGKLIENSRIVEDSGTVKAILVSNIPYEFCNTNLCATDLAESHKQKLLDRLTDEIDGFSETSLGGLHFYVTNIAIDDIETFLKGRATELFQAEFGPDFDLPVMRWVRLVESEITRKNAHPSDGINKVADLVQHKAIGKSLISSTLGTVKEGHRAPLDLGFYKNELRTAGWAVPEVIKLEKAVPRAFSDYKNPLNRECRVICERIASLIDACDLSTSTVAEVLAGVHDELSKTGQIPPPYGDTSYSNALILLVYHEKL